MQSTDHFIKNMRYCGIDALKHLLALGVVFIHIKSRSRYSTQTNDLISYFSNFVDGAVMGFFLISGFFAKEQKNLCPREISTFCIKAFRRLIVPFLVFSLVYAVLLALLGKNSLSAGLWATLCLQGSSMQLYFLPFLFYITVVFCLFTAASNHIKMKPTISLPLILIVLLVFSETHKTVASTGPDFRLLPLYAACFLIGFYLSKAYHVKKKIFYSITLWLVFISIWAASWDKRFWNVALILTLLTIGLVASAFPSLSDKRLPGSGGVYLLHAPIVIYFISAVLLKLGISEFTNVIFTLFATYLICLLTTLVFCRYCKSLSFMILE